MIMFSACPSNFPKYASDYGLMVPNGSYAITSSHCVQCSCVPGSRKYVNFLEFDFIYFSWFEYSRKIRWTSVNGLEHGFNAVYTACQHHWRFPVLACNAKIAISCSEMLQCNRVVLAAMLPPVIMGDLSMEP